MSMTVNISDTVNAFTATLTEQRTALVAELETLDQQRAGIVQQMGQIDRTLAALKAPAKVAATTATGTGRKMSEQGKANIKTALDARRARLAAEAEGKATEGVAVPEKGTEEQTAPAERVVEQKFAGVFRAGDIAEALEVMNAAPVVVKKVVKKAVTNATA